MKIIKKFENFILEFKETEKNTPVLYKDDNLEVKVVKTFDACAEQGKGTNWCSNYKSGYYMHSGTANMFRFNFKDGYKLRLTWDYLRDNGTHWGQGGVVNGVLKKYEYIFPKDASEPFLFDYKKDDKLQEMVNRIESIPQKVIDVVHKYQETHSVEKSANLNKMYDEISKIEVVGLEKMEETLEYFLEDKDEKYIITIKYLGKEYKIKSTYEKDYETDKYTFDNFRYSKEFKRDFKNDMGLNNTILEIYLSDKAKEFAKRNNISL